MALHMTEEAQSIPVDLRIRGFQVSDLNVEYQQTFSKHTANPPKTSTLAITVHSGIRSKGIVHRSVSTLRDRLIR